MAIQIASQRAQRVPEGFKVDLPKRQIRYAPSFEEKEQVGIYLQNRGQLVQNRVRRLAVIVAQIDQVGSRDRCAISLAYCRGHLAPNQAQLLASLRMNSPKVVSVVLP